MLKWVGAVVLASSLLACKAGLGLERSSGGADYGPVPTAGTGVSLPVAGSGDSIGEKCAPPPNVGIFSAPTSPDASINAANGFAGAVTSADVPPPPITGGTLITTRDATMLVASDPDRDLIYFIDNAARKLSHTIQLNPGDMPGRLAEDNAGRIHVVLRNAHAIASMTRDAQSPVTRRDVCDLPRGLAYDAKQDALRVVCAEGKLLTLASAPSGPVSKTVSIARDARDVIVRNDQVFVTQFRSATLMQVNADGSAQSFLPPTFTRTNFDACNSTDATTVDSTPTIA
ncbi:MAG TPA: hypothetical protein VHZ95_00740, partial [Polyangiales bacterium]|nr:hypothetical protein [Polyangiales bacterium]